MLDERERLPVSIIDDITGVKAQIRPDVDDVKRLAVDIGLHSIVSVFEYEISAGLISGLQHVSKFGYNQNTGATKFEDIWIDGGDYAFPTTAQYLTIQSTNSDDSFSGIGAQTICVQGLDTNYNEIEEIIQMNGTISVITTQQYLRCHRAYIILSGSTGSTQGKITMENSTDILAIVEGEDNQTEMAIYTVPAGKTAFLYEIDMNVGKGGAAECRMQFKKYGETFRSQYNIGLYQNAHRRMFKFPILFPEKTDLKLRAKSVTGNVEIYGTMEILLVDNTLLE